ncbi:uncharacterized protein [Triticum aestivum]|nr:uncharacterized protein LOC123133879 isoform X2 [Triticum aestivum]
MLLKFVEVSVMDYRQVILPLAGSFRWRDIKRDIAHAVNDPGKTIGDAKIDAVFSSIYSQAKHMDHQNGDNRQIRNLETLNKEEEMLKADTCEDEMNETAGLADAALSDKRVLSWIGCSKSQDTNSEVMDGEERISYE